MNQAIQQPDLNRIASEGAKIYSRIRSQYEPTKNGQFLAIEVDSGGVYLGKTSLEAANKARTAHPDKMSYTLRIGYDAAITLATPFFEVPHNV